MIHGLHVACTSRTAGGTLREREHKEEQDGEHHSRNRSGGLGEQVHNSDREQDQRDQAEANGDFDSADSEVERHLILTLARLLVAQHEDRKAIHRETPDHAEGIEIREKRHVAAADQNRQDLQPRDDIDNPVRRAELAVRLPEPVRKHSIFRNAVQHTVRAHNRRIHRAGQDHRAHHHDKSVKDQPCGERSL